MGKLQTIRESSSSRGSVVETLDLDLDLDPTHAAALAILAVPNSPPDTALPGAAPHSRGNLPADLPSKQHAAADTVGSTHLSPAADLPTTDALSAGQGPALPTSDVGSSPEVHASAASQLAVDTASDTPMADQQDLMRGHASDAAAAITSRDIPDLAMTDHTGLQHTAADDLPSASSSSSALLQSVTTEELDSDNGSASEVSTEQDLGSPASDVEQMSSPVSRDVTDSQIAAYSASTAAPGSPGKQLESFSEQAGQQSRRISHS